jgi:hypothetical protein
VLSLLVEFLCLELNIDEVCIFQQFWKLVKFSFLKYIQLLAKGVKEVNDAFTQLVFQVKFFAIRDLLTAVY